MSGRAWPLNSALRLGERFVRNTGHRFTDTSEPFPISLLITSQQTCRCLSSDSGTNKCRLSSRGRRRRLWASTLKLRYSYLMEQPELPDSLDYGRRIDLGKVRTPGNGDIAQSAWQKSDFRRRGDSASDSPYRVDDCGRRADSEYVEPAALPSVVSH